MTITVFLADDHAIVREGLRVLLNSQPGIKVIGEAANGREAVQQVVQRHPNVAVLDISMPDLNGIEAARRIRAESPATQVIILTMHATKEHIYQALKAGAQGYVLKESAANELIAAVRAVALGQRYLTPKITDQVIADYLTQGVGDEKDGPLSLLTAREREILQLVVEGKTSIEIGALIALSAKSVETYRSRLMQKLGIKDVPSLVKFAIQHGITSLE